ncbi:MAG: bifunctional 5,10-methylenetetrahydrofolate dehydrogenase/5,10-methenyltetrahydrofolate cyclohydrolase [Minisyncoccia bacterium]
MTIIIDGKKISDEILAKVKNEVASLSFKPIFCDVLVGNDPVSLQYVKMKMRMAESVGIGFHESFFPSSVSTENLIKEIKLLNNIPNMCGVIVQLPLPEYLDNRRILDAIDPDLDVDCLGTVASEKFYKNKMDLHFPTALACMTLLDSLNLNLNDKKIVVLGQGELVGKPVTALLHFRGLSPVTISSKTENKENLIKEADIIISGIGDGKYITGNMIKKSAVIIDAGTSESKGGVIGDVDLESVKGIAGFVSPVPGGVGPITIAMLFSNVLSVAKNKHE